MPRRIPRCARAATWIHPGWRSCSPTPATGTRWLSFAWDGLWRSLGELLTTVTILKERGIALLSLQGKIDTSPAAGELIFHPFGTVAHFEHRLVAERTKDGIAAARACGKVPAVSRLVVIESLRL